MRIVFLGTPDFAVYSLEAIIKAGFEVAAVITAPDKPAGRGMQLQQSAVKKCALKHTIPVLQPVKLKDPEFLNELASFKADLQVVIAFRMLPEAVWNMPPLGTINLHASLLPDYRGAAPINWAIINGETKTGVTTFFLKHAIDTGDMLLQQECSISEHTNAGELHDMLAVIGADTIVKSLELIQSGNYKTISQQTESQKTAPKIFTDTCKINWNQPVKSVYDLIRGLSPYPTAFTELNGKKLKVFGSTQSQENINVSPGTIDTDGRTYLKVACANGWIYLTDVQAESKKRMLITEFLKGYRN